MTQNERKLHEHLQECFDKLQSDYQCAQNEIKELKNYIELLLEICHENYIDVPDIDEPVPF